MVFIYIIKLEKGKYYIGKINNPQFRLESYINSDCSKWTKIYKPLRVIDVKPNCDDYDEDKIII
jgi:predicted GIY-YIG superfamily endonuclease